MSENNFNDRDSMNNFMTGSMKDISSNKESQLKARVKVLEEERDKWNAGYVSSQKQVDELIKENQRLQKKVSDIEKLYAEALESWADDMAENDRLWNESN